MKVGVIIVCAGWGRRLKNPDKAIMKLKGKPLFLYSLNVFERVKDIKQIILVLRKSHFSEVKSYVSSKQDITLVEGGRRRSDSVGNGLRKIREDIEYILIHDGARPLIREELVRRVLRALKRYPAVVCGVKVRDTLKMLDKQMIVRKTLERNNLFLIQTPQGFKKELILAGYKGLYRDAFDDAQVLELRGDKVKVVYGDIFNIKITYPEDVKLAEAIM